MASNANISIQEEAEALRILLVGVGLIEQHAFERISVTKGELRELTKHLKNKAKKVQEWYMEHPDSKLRHRQEFTKEVYSERIPAIAELVKTVWDLAPDNIYEVAETVKTHIQGLPDGVDIDTINELAEEMKSVRNLSAIKVQLLAIIRNQKYAEQGEEIIVEHSKTAA